MHYDNKSTIITRQGITRFKHILKIIKPIIAIINFGSLLADSTFLNCIIV